MVSPDTILNAVKRALKAAPGVIDEFTYVIHGWDKAGVDANVRGPVIELTFISMTRSGSIGDGAPIRDDNGGIIGYLKPIPFSGDIQVDINIAAGAGYDIAQQGTNVRTALYRYDDAVRDEPLRAAPTQAYPDGEPIDTITRFTVDGGTPRLDVGTTPSTRRWTTTIETGFLEVIDTVDEYGPAEYVKNVVWAHDGDMVSDADGETISYDPHQHFP